MNLRDVGRILVLRNLGSDFLTSRFFFTSFLDPGKRQWFNDVVGVYKVWSLKNRDEVDNDSKER